MSHISLQMPSSSDVMGLRSNSSAFLLYFSLEIAMGIASLQLYSQKEKLLIAYLAYPFQLVNLQSCYRRSALNKILTPSLISSLWENIQWNLMTCIPSHRHFICAVTHNTRLSRLSNNWFLLSHMGFGTGKDCQDRKKKKSGYSSLGNPGKRIM